MISRSGNPFYPAFPAVSAVRAFQIVARARPHHNLLTKREFGLSEDILADDALFQLGDIYEHHLNDKEKAAEYYKTILFDYKGSLHGVEARKRFRMLRGDKAISEEEGL